MSGLHISTAGPRLVHVEYSLAIRDQCLEHRVPFFFKQWGGVHKKKAGPTS